ncbi:hypothetical protein PACTADRAFT_52132 [Pachysolen tannophilus NRRL Y-2460]|uniref:Glycine cleavage system H protein n=1 Tax=Pachysolen tannophilus NRRL Y-2460 TaxID=669874 RepID=A0A1E4TMX1_PACTA|nr:hypothetical protein PACTADRAFT_52132 [Pachysolen tannophilus NRRL Y-2460]
MFPAVSKRIIFSRFSTIHRASVLPAATSFVRFNSSINKINQESIVGKYSPGPIVLRYSQEHEWVAAHPDGTTFIGITKYAADAIGDATYVELPDVSDEVIEQGASLGSVESVKSASEIYSPVNGEIIEANKVLSEKPDLINSDPMGEGWIVKMKIFDTKQLDEGDLFDEKGYQKYLEDLD